MLLRRGLDVRDRGEHRAITLGLPATDWRPEFPEEEAQRAQAVTHAQGTLWSLLAEGTGLRPDGR